MIRTWAPTSAGKLFTGSVDWRLTLDNTSFKFVINGRQHHGQVPQLASLAIKPGAFWATVIFTTGSGQKIKLDGLPNEEVHPLESAIKKTIDDIEHQAQVDQLLATFGTSIAPVIAWSESMVEAAKEQISHRGWITSDFIQQQLQCKPNGFKKLLESPEVVRHIENQPAQIQQAIRLWSRDFQEFADSINERHAKKQLKNLEVFFETVEKSPLTEEQTQAVICFDNRVLLVASAGSGKTSTMVAKAGYALKNGYVEAERMLLLAFNNEAAKELGQRIRNRLGPLNLPAEKIAAKTFHSFGLDVIGQVTGKRPTLAPWVENGKDLEHLLRIVDSLKDKDLNFRIRWDLFRIVLGQDLPKFGKEAEGGDSWNAASKTEGFWTLNNEVVKSRGEQLIANWLFYNGVRYAYEAAYVIETADSQHRQYHPDFYLIDANAYLEHWALNEHGEPPAEFVGYKEGMAWKKALHATYKTTLLETTMAGIWNGEAFGYLEKELSNLGLTLDPNPDRPAPGRKPIENPRLARNFRTFLTHTKSNRLTLAELRDRLHSGVAGEFRFRHSMFLDLFERTWKEWESQLSQSKCIDFEDMLNKATDYVEQGKWESPYDLVMVDEFQDASQARARLLSGLVSKHGKHLFAVGDDWQSINRFAGADLNVMTRFEEQFGTAVTLRLETTFRCPQRLCDISSGFVQKNPKQFQKNVRSSRADVADPIAIVRVEDERQIRPAIEDRLYAIAADAISQNKKVKVLVLGRYLKDKDYLPSNFDPQFLDLQFNTVHSSKGLEADHVILPKMTSDTLGFPSKVSDDPVLLLAMPHGEDFEYAEERRLFYVAMTRASESVTLIAVKNKESAFVMELLRDFKITTKTWNGSVDADAICPQCGNGFLVKRSSKYGPFMSCNRFPRCDFKRNGST